MRNDAAFLHFCLKESSENMIFPWNGNILKLTKKWSFLPFSQIFVRRKFFFSCSGSYLHLKSFASNFVLCHEVDQIHSRHLSIFNGRWILVYFWHSNIFLLCVLTDRISLSGCLYFVRYINICISIVCYLAGGS